MSDSGKEPELRISVIGAFRVLGEQGEDLTPRGRKARALLGILALTPTRRRSRSALQDKLWSDRGPEQAAASLRQTLTEIRRSLGERYRAGLITDVRGIGLADDRVAVDIDTADLAMLARIVEPPELLEDVDVADEEFEHWLRDQRTAFEQRLIALRARPAAAMPTASAEVLPPRGQITLRPWVRVVPPLAVTSESGLFLSRLVGDRITRALAEHWGIEVCDDGKGPQGVQIRIDALPICRDVTVNVALLSADGLTQLWSGAETIPLDGGFISDAPPLRVLVNQAVEIAGYHLNRVGSSPDGSRAFLQAYEAVQRMFRIDLDEVDRADALLGSAYDLEPHAVYLAWRAYARTFYAGEHVQADRRAAVDQSEELVRRALEAEPHNATVLALSSYVYSFAFRKYEVGHEMAELSIRYNPAHPLGHAFLGRAKSYLGNHDAGYRATCNGRELSGQAPYRYKLHFLCGVTALLSGRFDEAVRAAEIACAMAPGYRPPQRYLVPLYLRFGEREKAREAFEKLRRIEPSFSLDAMRETAYPSTAVREAGLLNFSDRDL